MSYIIVKSRAIKFDLHKRRFESMNLLQNIRNIFHKIYETVFQFPKS